MPSVKYDVSGDIPETQNAPVGTYRAKIKEAEARDSNAGNPMVVITWELTHTADGKRIKDDLWPVRLYLMVEDDRPYAKRTIKEFVTALGLKTKGALDLKELIGKTAQLRLKSDTDQDGEYQPRIGKVLAPADADPAEAEEEPEEPEEQGDNLGEDDEEELDLDQLSRAELKALIKEEELEIRVLKSMSDDDLRAAIAEAMGGEEEEDDAEPEEEPEGEAEAEDDGYDDMSVGDLKAELKERELPTNGAKKVLIQRLRKDDTEEPF